MLIECFCEDIGIASSDVSVALRHAKDEKAEKLEEVRGERMYGANFSFPLVDRLHKA